MWIPLLQASKPTKLEKMLVDGSRARFEPSMLQHTNQTAERELATPIQTNRLGSPHIQ